MVQADSKWFGKGPGSVLRPLCQHQSKAVWFPETRGSILMLAGCDRGDVQSLIMLTVIHVVSSSACGGMICLSSVSSIWFQVPWGGDTLFYLSLLLQRLEFFVI